MKLWIDDARPMPDGFHYHAKTAEEAINFLKENRVIFLDRDVARFFKNPDSVNAALRAVMSLIPQVTRRVA